MARTYVEISKENLLHNLSIFRKLLGSGVKIAFVVKANAYGHGMEKIVKILERQKEGVDWYAVDSIKEALTVRELAPKKPIIIIGYVPKGKLKSAIASDISLTLYDKEALLRIKKLKLNKKAKVHLKIETGLNRQGLELNEALGLAGRIKRSKAMQLEGISSHFANATEPLSSDFTKKQISRFKKALSEFGQGGYNPPFAHLSETAGSLICKDSHFDMVRLGIGLYGLWPSKEVKKAYTSKEGELDIRPVLSWKTMVVQVKEVPKDAGVGYGKLWRAKRDSKIAIIPIGYSDGYDRMLTNSSKVIINGRLVPVVGRVAMNMVVADVTELGNVKQEDEVVLIGESGDNKITASMLAGWSDTIPHEVTSRINPAIRRVVTD